MLEGLDAIDWAALTHAYGSAADVPNLLRALASTDAERREEAINALFGNIWHQGTVYPATAVAVPYLYEILDHPAPTVAATSCLSGKSGIAYLLASIAAGRGYLEVHAASEFGEKSWRKILEKGGRSLENEIEREAAETRSVRQAASRRLLDLVPYLNDPESEIRRVVAEALGDYPEHASTTLPALQKALHSEADDEVIDAITESIDRLKAANH